MKVLLDLAPGPGLGKDTASSRVTSEHDYACQMLGTGHCTARVLHCHWPDSNRLLTPYKGAGSTFRLQCPPYLYGTAGANFARERACFAGSGDVTLIHNVDPAVQRGLERVSTAGFALPSYRFLPSTA